MSKESEFLRKVQETFKAELEDHHAAMMAGLLELEKGESGTERDLVVIENVFREAHSLKGAARAVNMIAIEQVCQSMESIFSALKKEYRRPAKESFEALYRALDLIAALSHGTASAPEQELMDVLRLLDSPAPAPSGSARLKEQPRVAPSPSPITASRKAPISLSETVRVSAAQLGSIFLQAEETLSVKQAMTQHAADLFELQNLQIAWNKEWAKVGSSIRTLRQQSSENAPLRRLLEFMDWRRAQDGAIRLKLDKLWTGATLDNLHAGERVERLLAEIRTALLLPFSSLLELFPRMIRDLSVEERKEVDWDVQGEDTRIDRRVLEEIKDPLIHIVRNSISHGIEAPGERERLGKPRAGSISLVVEQADKEKIMLTVSDDGAGIDLDQVKAAAVSRGFLSGAEAAVLNETDARHLIFLPELSTSSMITDLAGRGLGLAIAMEKIEAIGGQLSVETARGKGTSFLIQIPLTLATFRGVLVKSRGQTFVIPTASVDRVLRVDPSMVVLLEGQESIPLDGRAVCLVDLADILGLESSAGHDGGAQRCPAIVLFVAGTRIAFRIEEVLGEQEVLAKNLGKQLVRVRNISGATVLSSGDVVPILNPSDLLKSVSLLAGNAVANRPGPQDREARKILVAEDSLTSRILLKSILEAAGYEVQTAVDGAEALAALRVTEFDLLVSDIEMPRMNGLALCREVRDSSGTTDLPIILVTTLDSREDREKGIEAGANAYLVKSSFDQTNLLDVVKRLL
jgi:two-component system chemotaxis sensor kinase CheA